MTEYQTAWLLAHHERSEGWLREKLAEGFDVHHLDGDKGNNAAGNLVLIECGDHMMLHNGKKRFSRVVGKNRGGGRPKKPKVEISLIDSVVGDFRWLAKKIEDEKVVDWAAIDAGYEVAKSGG